MAWCDERERDIVLKLNEAFATAVEESNDLNRLETPQISAFVVAASALMFAQGALIAYFDAFNCNVNLPSGIGNNRIQ